MSRSSSFQLNMFFQSISPHEDYVLHLINDEYARYFTNDEYTKGTTRLCSLLC